MNIILATLPLATIFFLILVLRWSMLRTIISALLVLLLVTILAWQVYYNWILAASLKGFLFALEIALIIIGAVFFLSVLELSGFQEKIKILIQDISQDKMVQIMIVAWAFTALIEGGSGFGVPAILATTLLITLGFPTVPAISLSLIGAALHVAFGAVGTPILFGFRASLTSPEIINYLQIQNISMAQFLKEIGSHIAAYNLLLGLLICFILAIMFFFFFEKKEGKRIKSFLEKIPFLIVASFLVTFPAYLLASYLGPELPSLVGGFVGLFLLFIIVQKGWFLPKTEVKEKTTAKREDEQGLSLLLKIFQILSPYFFLALIIFISRADFLPIEQWLMNFSRISLNQIWGSGVNYSFSPFYSLGILLLLSGVILSFFFRQSAKIKTNLKQSFEKTKGVILVLILMLIFVQIFIYSGENLNNYQSMPIFLANAIVEMSGNLWPIFIPLIGALGAFITGSATVSNLLFGNFQANSALILGADPRLFLFLQGIGAALGNMLALHNIIVILAIVGQLPKVNLIIKYNLLPLLFLCLLSGLIGFLIF